MTGPPLKAQEAHPGRTAACAAGGEITAAARFARNSLIWNNMCQLVTSVIQVMYSQHCLIEIDERDSGSETTANSDFFDVSREHYSFQIFV